MSRVRVLPDRVVDQIAAGEVVERPSSVVKELVDNALDAGASRIEIAIEGAGIDRITVADDGAGMDRDEALLALERHATSKIGGLDDLARIETLGFRGEALPSIASVSRLVVETAVDGGEGSRIRVEAGEVTAVEPVARGAGTTVDVRGLFYNTPARRKFLKTPTTEQAHNVQRLLESVVARTDVGWRASHGGRELFDLAPARSLAERLAALYDPAYVETLLEVHAEEGRVRVRGLVQRAAAATAARRRQFVLVNGRPIDGGELARAALRGYRSTLPRGARPDLYLFVEVDPAALDVNVHPAKREVRFGEPAGVAAVVEAAVREALGSGPVATQRSRAPGAGRVAERRGGPEGDRTAGQLGMFWPGRAAAGGGSREPDAEPEDAEVVGRIESGATGDADAGPAPGLWQLHRRYVLAQTATGVVVIDQHSAHERILYEEIVDELRDGRRPGQRLLFPGVVHLSAGQRATWEEYAGLIARLGFDIEAFGGDALAITAAPAFRHAFDHEAALVGLLDDLGRPGSGSADMNQHERVARLFACKAAIKAGQALGADEMIELVDRLFATRLPYDDVHGRPAVVQIALADLDRQFGRH